MAARGDYQDNQALLVTVSGVVSQGGFTNRTLKK